MLINKTVMKKSYQLITAMLLTLLQLQKLGRNSRKTSSQRKPASQRDRILTHILKTMVGQTEERVMLLWVYEYC